jgi:DNA-binding XRE family transcriptional regulator
MSKKHKKSAEHFRELRIKMCLSRKELGKLLDIAARTIIQYEFGYRNPSVGVCQRLIKLAKLKGINITLEYLRPDE